MEDFQNKYDTTTVMIVIVAAIVSVLTKGMENNTQTIIVAVTVGVVGMAIFFTTTAPDTFARAGVAMLTGIGAAFAVVGTFASILAFVGILAIVSVITLEYVEKNIVIKRIIHIFTTIILNSALTCLVVQAI